MDIDSNENNIITIDDKKEFIALDFFRIIAAFLIVTIHISMFSDYSYNLEFWTDQILARIAVPFFFISSGFFLYNTINKNKIGTYIKRLLVMYLAYTIVYIPVIINNLNNDKLPLEHNITDFIRDFFITGSFVHLWFFVGLIVATMLLYILVIKIKLSDKNLLVLGSILYIIGVLGNGYRNIVVEIPIIKDIFIKYYDIFITTRNGVFFGFIFVTLGYIINKNKDKIRLTNKYLYYAIIAFIFMNIESCIISALTGDNSIDIIFSNVFVTLFLFLALISINVPIKYSSTGICLRKISVIIFGLHLIIKDCIEMFLIHNGLILNSLQIYIIVILVNIILAVIIIYLQRVKQFRWLKNLY